MKYVSETLTALSATVGWALLVWAAYALLTPWALQIGAGLYLMGLAGFRLVGVIAYHGLLAMSGDTESGEEGRG